MLKDMKKQLAELLHDLNFVASKNPRDPQSNIHSGQYLNTAVTNTSRNKIVIYVK